MFLSRKVRIVGTGSYAPRRIVLNKELVAKAATSEQWIEENLGIKERHVAAEGEKTSDLCVQAARKALESAGVNKEDLDLIIVATATPDRKAPSTACLVKHKLGIVSTCPAMDLAAVCSGFVYALTIGSALIEANSYKRILIIGADTFSSITDWTRRDCVFFGDGAGAIVLEKSDSKLSFFSSEIYSETSNTDHFTVFSDDPYFTMNGRAVYDTGTKVLPETIVKLLKENDLTIDDVSCVIPHQPSVRLLQKTAELLDMPFEKIKMNMMSYANTASATVALLLDEVNRKGQLKTNDLVVFAAVGAGWTWGAALYRWH